MILKLESCYSRVPRPRLLPAMPETHPTPDPIPIRPRLRRQSPNLRELRTKKTRTTGSGNVLPRLLKGIEDMWLLDLRETRERSYAESSQERQTRRVSAKRSIIRKHRTRGSSNVKTPRIFGSRLIGSYVQGLVLLERERECVSGTPIL